MLSKGTELFMFESEFYTVKKKYINQDFTEETWKALMEDGEKLLKKYHIENEIIRDYCFRMFSAFVDFMRYKEDMKNVQ